MDVGQDLSVAIGRTAGLGAGCGVPAAVPRPPTDILVDEVGLRCGLDNVSVESQRRSSPPSERPGTGTGGVMVNRVLMWAAANQKLQQQVTENPIARRAAHRFVAG